MVTFVTSVLPKEVHGEVIKRRVQNELGWQVYSIRRFAEEERFELIVNSVDEDIIEDSIEIQKEQIKLYRVSPFLLSVSSDDGYGQPPSDDTALMRRLAQEVGLAFAAKASYDRESGVLSLTAPIVFVNDLIADGLTIRKANWSFRPISDSVHADEEAEVEEQLELVAPLLQADVAAIKRTVAAVFDLPLRAIKQLDTSRGGVLITFVAPVAIIKSLCAQKFTIRGQEVYLRKPQLEQKRPYRPMVEPQDSIDFSGIRFGEAHEPEPSRPPRNMPTRPPVTSKNVPQRRAPIVASPKPPHEHPLSQANTSVSKKCAHCAAGFKSERYVCPSCDDYVECPNCYQSASGRNGAKPAVNSLISASAKIACSQCLVELMWPNGKRYVSGDPILCPNSSCNNRFCAVVCPKCTAVRIDSPSSYYDGRLVVCGSCHCSYQVVRCPHCREANYWVNADYKEMSRIVCANSRCTKIFLHRTCFECKVANFWPRSTFKPGQALSCGSCKHIIG